MLLAPSTGENLQQNIEPIAMMAEENRTSIPEIPEEITRLQRLAHALEASVSRFRI
jgi:hypothetical protein